MITIIAKKAFKFVKRGEKNIVVDTKIVRPGILTQLPDWCKDDALFKLAEKDGAITYVESKKVTPGASLEPPNTKTDEEPPKTDDPPNGDDPKTDEEPPKTGRGRQRG